jgi:hypothetical protein
MGTVIRKDLEFGSQRRFGLVQSSGEAQAGEGSPREQTNEWRQANKSKTREFVCPHSFALRGFSCSPASCPFGPPSGLGTLCMIHGAIPAYGQEEGLKNHSIVLL